MNYKSPSVEVSYKESCRYGAKGNFHIFLNKYCNNELIKMDTELEKCIKILLKRI